MEKTHSIIYLPVALADLQQIVDYITLELKSPQSAQNFISRFDDAIVNLEYFPSSGAAYRGSKGLENQYRFLVVDHYLVFYIVNISTVVIHRVIYARRKLDELF